jgi:hypothetical protein
MARYAYDLEIIKQVCFIQGQILSTYMDWGQAIRCFKQARDFADE